MRNRRRGINRRRWGLIVLVLCLGISFSLWKLESNRTKFEFREVSKCVLSTNNYKGIKTHYNSSDEARNVLLVDACRTNISSFSKMLAGAGSLSEHNSLYGNYWKRFLYDLQNDRVFSVAGPILHYDVQSENTLYVRKESYNPKKLDIQRINKWLNKVGIFGGNLQFPLKDVSTISQPVYFGVPGRGVKLKGGAAYSGSNQIQRSPGGQFVFLPDVSDEKGKKMGPWIVDMSDGEVLSVPDMIAGIPGIPIENVTWGSKIIWLSESELTISIVPKSNGYFSYDEDYLILFDVEARSCRLLLNRDILQENFRQHGLIKLDTGQNIFKFYRLSHYYFKWFKAEKLNGDIILTLEVFKRGTVRSQDKVSLLEFNERTGKSILKQYDYGAALQVYPIHFEDHILIEKVWDESQKNISGYVIRNRDSGEILWSLNSKSSRGGNIKIRVANGALFLFVEWTVWRCELDGSNPVPLIPFDAPIIWWDEIISPMKEVEFNQDHF